MDNTTGFNDVQNAIDVISGVCPVCKINITKKPNKILGHRKEISTGVPVLLFAVPSPSLAGIRRVPQPDVIREVIVDGRIEYHLLNCATIVGSLVGSISSDWYNNSSMRWEEF